MSQSLSYSASRQLLGVRSVPHTTCLDLLLYLHPAVLAHHDHAHAHVRCCEGRLYRYMYLQVYSVVSSLQKGSSCAVYVLHPTCVYVHAYATLQEASLPQECLKEGQEPFLMAKHHL